MIQASPTTVSLAWFLVLPALGRCLLAWLPPGLPGRHAGRDVGATWAASFVIAWTVVVALAQLARSGLGASGALGASGSAWNTVAIVLAALAVVAGLVRYLARPAKMVPRHEPALERESSATRALSIVALVVAAWPVVDAWRDPSPIEVRSFASSWLETDIAVGALRVALVLLVAHALEIARCAPWLRAAGCLLVAGVFWLAGGEPSIGVIVAASSAGIGAALAIPWLRRGDARAMYLSMIAYAGAALCSSSGWMLATAGILWLVAGTPRPARRTAAIVGATVVVATIAIGPGRARIGAWMSGSSTGGVASRPEFTTTPLTTAILAAMLMVVVFALWKRARPSSRPSWTPSGARPGHEDAILLRALITFLVLRLVDARFSKRPSLDDPLLPTMVLLAISCTLAARTFTRGPTRP